MSSVFCGLSKGFLCRSLVIQRWTWGVNRLRNTADQIEHFLGAYYYLVPAGANYREKTLVELIRCQQREYDLGIVTSKQAAHCPLVPDTQNR